MIRSRNIRADAEKDTGLLPDEGTTFKFGNHAYVFVNGGRVHLWTKKIRKSVELKGVHVEVNATGQASRQFSGVGLLAFGVLGASKKKDTRQLFLVVMGTDDTFTVKLHPDAVGPAVAIAAKYNVCGHQALAATMTH